MKRILVVSILLTLVVSLESFAASTRWNALGGDHRFIIDTTNYTVYPGRVTMFGNAIFVIPVPNFTRHVMTVADAPWTTWADTGPFFHVPASFGDITFTTTVTAVSPADKLSTAWGAIKQYR
jgi:hypothetical protein